MKTGGENEKGHFNCIYKHSHTLHIYISIYVQHQIQKHKEASTQEGNQGKDLMNIVNFILAVEACPHKYEKPCFVEEVVNGSKRSPFCYADVKIKSC